MIVERPPSTAAVSSRFAFRVLGPLEVRLDDRPLPLTATKQRALLAVLLLHANEVVSKERLLAELWGDEAPLTAPKMLQVFVSRLRRALGLNSAEGVLETHPLGYALRVEPDRLDLLQFQALTAAGRDQLPTDPSLASTRFAQALALWRGPALSDLADEPFARAAIARLDELRMAAVENRIDADLALGRHTTVVAELQELLAGHRFRERVTAQLMLALYRSGRQAEALEVFRTARAALVEELGIEPSVQLQRLHVAILRQDPSLDLAEKIPRPESKATAAVEDPAAIEGPTRRRRSSRRRLIYGAAGTVAAATVGVVLLTALVLGLLPGPAGVAAASNSVAIVDPSTGSVLGAVLVGGSPGPIVVAGGSVWVGNRRDLTVSRVDLRSRTVVRTFGLADTPEGLTASDGMVWITNGFSGTLSRILTAYDQLSAPFFPGPTLSGLVAAQAVPGDLWVGLSDNSLLRLDPASLRVKSTLTVLGRPRAIVVDSGSVWTIQFFDYEVKMGAPGTGVVSVAARLQTAPQAIAAGAGAIWVATAGDDRLWKIDPASGQIQASVPLGLPPSAIAATASAVWVASANEGVLEEVDPKAATLVRTVRIGHPIGGLALAVNQVLVTVD